MISNINYWQLITITILSLQYLQSSRFPSLFHGQSSKWYIISFWLSHNAQLAMVEILILWKCFLKLIYPLISEKAEIVDFLVCLVPYRSFHFLLLVAYFSCVPLIFNFQRSSFLADSWLVEISVVWRMVTPFLASISVLLFPARPKCVGVHWIAIYFIMSAHSGWCLGKSLLCFCITAIAVSFVIVSIADLEFKNITDFLNWYFQNVRLMWSFYKIA